MNETADEDPDVTTAADPLPATPSLTASGLEAALAALPPVYAAAARTRTVPLAAGALTAAGPFSEPVVLVRLRVPLADRAVVVRGVPAGPDQAPQYTVFAPFSGAGTLLPVPVPPTALAPQSAMDPGGLTVPVTVHNVADPDCHTPGRPDETKLGPPLSDADAGALVEGVVLEGVLARLTYLCTMEKQRIIRQAREISACRHVDLAFSNALDGLGADLGVPRRPQEDDAVYRARLEMFTAWRLPTPAGLLAALNGPGAGTDPNRGLPSRVGVRARFGLVEEQNTLSLSTKLVDSGPGGPARRARFHEVLRAVYLLDLDQPVPATLPPGRRGELAGIQQRLAAALVRPGDQQQSRWLAPTLAAGLDRLVQLMRALGDTQPLALRRAHVTDPDPLYELGLGALLDQLAPQRLTDMSVNVPALANGTFPDGTALSTEMTALARGLRPDPVAKDPLGRWLFEAIGLRTVHPPDAATVYLSTLPTAGLTIDGPASLPADQPVYHARYVADAPSSGLHVLAAEAVQFAQQLFNTRGLDAVQPVIGDALNTALAGAAASSDATPPSFLPALADTEPTGSGSAAFAQSVLNATALDQVAGYPFGRDQLTAFGDGGAVHNAVAARVAALRDSGFYAVRGLWDGPGNRLLVLAAVGPLPGVPGSPGEPPPAEFRWQNTELMAPPPPPAEPGRAADPGSPAGPEQPAPPDGPPPVPPPLTLSNALGGGVQAQPVRDGLALLVCLGFARRGLADPYEIRVQLPDNVALDPEQYGYVMNLLDTLCPAGIEINTADLRRALLRSGGATPAVDPSADPSRTYHRYRRRRTIGADSVDALSAMTEDRS